MQALHLIVAIALILVAVFGNIASQRTRRARRSSGFAFFVLFVVGMGLLIAHSVRYSVAWGPQETPFAVDCRIVQCAAAHDYRR